MGPSWRGNLFVLLVPKLHSETIMNAKLILAGTGVPHLSLGYEALNERGYETLYCR